MKKILLSLTLFISLSSAFAQSTMDSVMMNSGYKTDVYYSMKNGFVDSSSNSNWHLAFAIRPALPPNNTLQSASVRINEARGVNVYKSSFSISQWASFDSAGNSAWTSLHDNDSSWDLGAFNYGANAGAFNYGWGTYDMTSHDVIGTNIYLIRIKNGTTYNYRKFMIQRLIRDTQWVFTFSNLDGTDSNTVKISKAAYANKMFAYYNLQGKNQFSREPNATQWDIVFTYFNTPVLLGPPPAIQYNVAGVLSNPLSPVARIKNINKNTVAPSAVTLINQANTINWDWANPPMGPPPADYALIDSMAFFVKCQADGRPYRLYFTKFTTNDPGKFVFNKTWFPGAGVKEFNNKSSFSFYPNPANSNLHIALNENSQTATLHIFDITGKVIAAKNITSNETDIDISHLNKGIYFITIESNGTRQSKKLIVE